MTGKASDTLKGKLDDENYQKLMEIDNPHLHEFIAKYIELCDPKKIFVCTDSARDIKYIRESAIKNGEEMPLAIEGHTIHFDAYGDQGRDKEHSPATTGKGRPWPLRRRHRRNNPR